MISPKRPPAVADAYVVWQGVGLPCTLQPPGPLKVHPQNAKVAGLSLIRNGVPHFPRHSFWYQRAQVSTSVRFTVDCTTSVLSRSPSRINSAALNL